MSDKTLRIPVQRVDCFQTSDGRGFTSKSEAEGHQLYLDKLGTATAHLVEITGHRISLQELAPHVVRHAPVYRQLLADLEELDNYPQGRNADV